MEVHRQRPSIFFPMILIAIGAFFLLANLGIVQNDVWSLFATYWPVLLIVGGLDGLYQRESWIGSLLLVGLGVLLLLTNLGVLPWDTWFLIPRLWPVFLVAIGLDLIFGRRNAIGSVIGAIIIIALVAGVLFFSNLGLPGSRQQATQTISQSLEGATRADVKITMVAGETRLTGAAGNELLQGTVVLDKNERLKKSYAVQNNTATLILEPDTSFFIPSGGMHQKIWDLRINNSIPVNLTSEVVFGTSSIDTSEMQLDNLNAKAVFGTTTIILKPQGAFSGRVEGVFGKMTIIVPPDAAVRIKTESAISSVKVPREFSRHDDVITSPGAEGSANLINLDVSQVFGSIVIQYAQP